MKLKDVLAISGKPGLFIYISQGRNGIIVESVIDKKRMAVHSTTKVSALEDIAIYTETEEVPLKEVLLKLYEKEDGKQTISHKSSNEELKTFFESILPDYDKDRVYVSDIKKLVSWYNLLIEYKLLNPEDLKDEEEDKEEDKADKKAEEEKPDTDEKEEKE
jgi:hypothetical protein